jgi:glucan-binding YG repeat protein
MKEKNRRTKKMTQKIMIFLAVMICVGMISAVTTTAVTNDKTPTTTNQAENKSNVTKTTVNKNNTDLNNKETVNKNNTDSNNKTIKAKSKKQKTPVAKFKTKKGKTYCKISGKKIKNQLVTVKNKTYLFDKKGVMVTGWAKYKKDYYYFGPNANATLCHFQPERKLSVRWASTIIIPIPHKAEQSKGKNCRCN